MFRTSRKRAHKLAALGLTGAASVALLSGCSAEELETGFLPTEFGMTDKVDQVIHLWNWAWIAGLLIGILVWGLIITAMVAFRRKSSNDPLPEQKGYNVPLEAVYTLIPLLMIGVFFFYTAKANNDIDDQPEDVDVKIQAIGKQWAWDFNYLDEDVYETTQQLQLDGTDSPEQEMPTLYLPVNERVEIQLNSRDVQHSFWVPSFLFKRDMIPGVDNYWTFTPQQEGTYAGKCAELCGQYHSEMLFQVKVVDREEFDNQMEALRDSGNVGVLGNDLNRKTPAELAAEQAEARESDH